jgi:ribonuclease Z
VGEVAEHKVYVARHESAKEVHVAGEAVQFGKNHGRADGLRVCKGGCELGSVGTFTTFGLHVFSLKFPPATIQIRFYRRALIGPTGAKNLMTNLEKAYSGDIAIRIVDEKLPPQGIAIAADEFDKDGVVYERDGVKVTAFEVDHGDVIKPAYGYRIDYKGHSAVISGDTRYNTNVIKYGTGVDLLVHEVALARPELMTNLFAQAIIAHHTSPKDCGRVFTQAKPKLAAYTHLVFLSNEKVPEATLDDLIKQTRETYDGPLEVGEDLTSFEIGDTVTVTRWKQ